MSRTEETTITVDGDLPLIAGVRASEAFRVRVEWQGGGEAEVDLAPDILTFRLYAPLRDDRSLFESVTVVDEGNAIGWGRSGIDMPATAVERLAGEQMSAESIRAFMRRAHLTRDGLAAQLGVSRRLVGYWLEGQKIPRYIMLACRALAG